MEKTKPAPRIYREICEWLDNVGPIDNEWEETEWAEDTGKFIANKIREMIKREESLMRHRSELEAEVERLKEKIKTAHADGAQILIESFEHTDLRKYIIELEAHTWQQERAAVAAKLRGWGFEIAADLIMQGNHWPEGGTP